MDDFFAPVDSVLQKKERVKARNLRHSRWWKQEIASGLCYYCGGHFSKSQLSMDHKVPIVRGGKNSRANVVVACKVCNSQKASSTLIEVALRQNTAPPSPES